ncbi:hypothetical protein FS837_007409 [Tulasnella sp. UAMH 9824]|nr:hypothetical protein FS837_007409 [Tulasnella sp. UAMH 9824]
MQTLGNNVPQNQKQDEQAQPLIESQVSKEAEAEQAGRTENDGLSQAAAGSISSSDPSATTIASTSDQPKPSTPSAVANESLSAPNNSTAPNPSSSTHHLPPAPKRFSSATISKQFLHKAASGAGSKSDSSFQHAKPAPSTSAFGGWLPAFPPISRQYEHTFQYECHNTLHQSKPDVFISFPKAFSRPAQPTPAAHPSRLVTAKLTRNGPSSASSTGWNTPRPNSATNPSSERPNSTAKSGTSGKPWGDMKRVTTSVSFVDAASDFPTPAEVARGKTSQVVKPPRQVTLQLTTDGTSITPLNEAEDAFHGVHLDLKAHHWDDEADDDDYLGEGVVLADGMQYNVPPTATAESHPSTIARRSRQH